MRDKSFALLVTPLAVMMRGRFLVLILMLGLFCSMISCSSISDKTTELVGQPVPDGRLMLLSGEDVALKNASGRKQVILFWATWCFHSKSVIASFEDLARTYISRGDMDFYAVNLDKNQDLDLVKARIKVQDLTTVTHVFSGNDTQDEAYLALQGDHVPYAVFIDERSIVRYVGLGVSGLEEFLARRFGIPKANHLQSE
jgi:thiol-disulfide isomerase/thioredoxin